MSTRPASPQIDTQQSFPALEERVLERWRERDVFERSVKQREGSPAWVFWEGPPTANGKPGVHHVLSRVFKDIFPRFQTMRGKHVERRGGWDCHGLPVEIAVEKQLGLHSKHDIENIVPATCARRSSSSTRPAATPSSPSSRTGTPSPSASASGST